ncbi:protein adenylyltransferase SelO, mitochondrial-like isoform X2 [Ornithodoros turicata]|uniref:protein adenylyltransferase SelO, mitochondrial-like isoform X2 n=1 Tax=Ornithodoros turicata TaxID=34597 RepID=UPI00313A4CBA
MLLSKTTRYKEIITPLIRACCRISLNVRCTMATFETLKFDNLALRVLPIDTEERNYVRTVRGACFSRVNPMPVKSPEIVAISESAMLLLDLPRSELERKEAVEYLSGNKLLPGSETASHCYCGHQFGYFAGQLGDGAAIYLGEVINHKGERWEIQLKGAGLTPYSRDADGRKVLRSTIREFLCSEAIHHLGIPTTRAGSCVTSSSTVSRDMFYDGHPKNEKCSIVLRIAPTFLRFGSFEIFKPLDPFTGRVGPSVGRNDILIQLLDYSVETFFPDIHQMYTNNQQEKYKAFFKEVLKKTAALVAGWQCVGFCHGVLNTDNMSITGLTLDYGPFGFLDWFDPDHICNSSDDGGRYTYIKQPEICLWNLRKFAEAIQGALPLSETSPILDMYNNEYEKCFLGRMRQKFGLLNKELQSDKDLVTSFYDAMESTGADFTRAFRCLSSLAVPGHVDHEESKKIVKGKLLSCSSSHCDMLERAKRSFKSRDFQLFLLLSQSNPELLDQLGKGMIARERIESQLKKAEKLMEISAEDMERRKDEVWSHWIDRYCERLHQEIDIGVDLHVLQLRRVQAMNSSNPRFILRNHIAQRAIEMAENGDYSEVVKVLKILEKPFSDDPLDLKGAAVCPAVFDEGFYEGRYALSAPPLRVSCSS